MYESRLLVLSESEIIKGCKQHSATHQRLLYQRYAPFLKGICHRYIKDKDVAKDILQDAFIKIFHSIGKYAGEGAIEGWMRRIMINVALDYLKKSKKLPTESVDDMETFDLLDEGGMSSETDQLLDAGFSAQDLLGILHRIPTEFATVFNMFYIDNLMHKEIGEVLKINESTSRKRLFTARNLLKKELEKELAARQKIYQ